MDIEALAKLAGLKLSNGSYWTNVSGTTADLHKFCDVVKADAVKAARDSAALVWELEHGFDKHGVAEWLRSNVELSGRRLRRSA